MKGTVRAEEILVETVTGADHVFDVDYNLWDLEKLAAYIHENKHLPGIASEQEMIEHGVQVNRFQIQLLEKIEELTVHTINQQRKIEELETLIKQQ